MGILASVSSITRYHTIGTIKPPVLDTIFTALNRYSISEIEDEHSEQIMGWVSFDNPYISGFSAESYQIGQYFLFSLRIDKKTISPRLVKKHMAIAVKKKLSDTKRDFLSKDEKKNIKDAVYAELIQRIPSTPSIYDILWKPEQQSVWLFTNLKSANDVFESLFTKSFEVSVIRIFPYTAAELLVNISDSQHDCLSALAPLKIMEV